MKKVFVVIITALSLFWIDRAAAAPQDADFQKVSDEFIGGYLKWRPTTATYLGVHDYDGKITDYSRNSITAELQRLKNFELHLLRFSPDLLSPQSCFDLRILLAGIRNELFHFIEMDQFAENPMTYAGALDLNIYAKRNFAPAEQRLRHIIEIEKQAPRIFSQARANLHRVLPQPFIETAIEMANGAADFLGKDLAGAFKGVGGDELQKEFARVNQRAVAELTNYAKWLEKEKLPLAHTHYALGIANFEKMLHQTELINLPAESILQLGIKELRREQRVFADTAKLIDPKKKPIEVFKEIQRDHPTAERLISDTAKNLDAIRQFIIERNIITIPSKVPATVEETPQYLRATSFASMDTPGPFEKKATEAYYYVTPVEANWSAKQKEEWLTAFNYYTTDVVSIHEAYPGHYVQFLWLNASNPSRVAKVFNSYCFVEGWAHYCEQLVIDEGYGRASSKIPTAEEKIRAAKFRLAQSDEALLRICRLCVSIQTHCEGMPLDYATKFFQDNCYYEKQPALQEARRGTYDPQYLLYTLGKLQFLKLRRDFQKQEGKDFSLQKFHDQLLQHGAPPIRLLREQMLKDGKSWNALF